MAQLALPPMRRFPLHRLHKSVGTRVLLRVDVDLTPAPGS